MRSQNRKLPMMGWAIAVVVLSMIVPHFYVRAQEPPPPADLFAATVPPPEYVNPDVENTLRLRFVTVNWDQLPTPDVQTLRLNLFEDQTYEANLAAVTVLNGQDFIWQGTLQGITDGHVTLAANKQAMVATISLPGMLYRVKDTGRGAHVIEEVPTSDSLLELQPLPAVPPESIGFESSRPAVDDGSLIDVLVVYTPASRARYGESGINALIDLAIAETNQAYTNSQIGTQLRLVYRGEINYVETPLMDIDLGRLQNANDGYLDEVHGLRDTYKADLVTLIEENGSTSGMAYQMSTPSAGFASSAFSVVASASATGYYSFGHELAHNMGSQHDRDNALVPGVAPYAYGHRVPTTFRTMMAYPCASPCQRVPYFSNPSVTYSGQPTGIDFLVDPDHAADNARAINDVKTIVANFRDSTAPPTATPTPTATSTPTATPTPTATDTPTATPTPVPYEQRVHVGSTATFTDGAGKVWAADRAYGTTGPWGYTTGTAKSTTTAVAGTTDDALYQKYREIVGEYRFQVPNGQYLVTLRFAEFTVTKATDRPMKITIEGVVVENNLSVYGVVGLATALDRTYTANVSDGLLTIAFAKGAGASKSPAINAILVKTAPPPTPTPTPTFTVTPGGPTFTPTPTPSNTPTPVPYVQRVQVGGTAAFTDGAGKVWAADRAYGTTGPWGYTTGTAKSVTTAVAGTTDDLLFQKYREIVGEYRFQVPNGTYQVTLRFAEFTVTNATDRRMHITIEGTRVQTDLSVWGTVGLATALDRTYTTTVSDGLLTIAFAKGTGARKSPAINAIEVRTP